MSFPFSGIVWSEGSCPIPGSSHVIEGNKQKLFALSWPLWRHPRECFLSSLIWSTGGSGGIVWMWGCRRLKTVAGTMAWKSWGGAKNLRAPAGKSFWQRNTTCETLRRSSGESLRGHKTFKSSHDYGEIGGGEAMNNIHRPREQACLERPKTISLHARLIPSSFSLQRSSPQRLGEVTVSSNIQLWIFYKRHQV